MPNSEIATIRELFDRLEPYSDQVDELFYNRLFDEAPELRAMFPIDILAQKDRLRQMLGTIVYNFHENGGNSPTIAALGRRHAAYGVRPEHYPLMGAVMVWAIHQVLGTTFTEPLRDAIAAAYADISAVMLAAAEEPMAA